MIFNETFLENTMEPNPYLYIRQMGILHGDPHYIIRRKNSATGVIGFVLSGKLNIQMGDQTLEISSQESFVLPDQTSYTIQADLTDPPHMNWMNVRGSLFSGVCQSLMHGKVLISQYHAQTDIVHIASLVKCHGNDQSAIKALLALLADIKFQEIEKASHPEDHGRSPARQWELYISNHIQYGFSVQEMAKYFYMSTDTLNRLFQKAFGVTPYQYYQNSRIQIAKILLKNPSLSIEDIALRLHFTDRNYFSMYFKSKTGCTPVAFRKNAQQHFDL